MHLLSENWLILIFLFLNPNLHCKNRILKKFLKKKLFQEKWSFFVLQEK